MKKLLLLVVLIFCVSSTALAFQNEPTGFRGLPWGSPFEDFKAKYPNYQSVPKEWVLDEEGRVKIYSVYLKDDSISGIPIEEPIEYHFYDNKLMAVRVNLTGEHLIRTRANEEKMASALDDLYGHRDPEIFEKGMTTKDYSWKGPICEISLVANYITSGDVYYYDLALNILSMKIYNEYSDYVTELRQKKERQGW